MLTTLLLIWAVVATILAVVVVFKTRKTKKDENLSYGDYVLQNDKAYIFHLENTCKKLYIRFNKFIDTHNTRHPLLDKDTYQRKTEWALQTIGTILTNYDAMGNAVDAISAIRVALTKGLITEKDVALNTLDPDSWEAQVFEKMTRGGFDSARPVPLILREGRIEYTA